MQENIKKFITLDKLEVYSLLAQLSKIAGKIYQHFNWQIKKIIGNQFIESTDYVGANIAEGYGRFHYLDRIKFFYNSRGSLLESRHWFERLRERELISNNKLTIEYLKTYEKLRPKLNAFIQSNYHEK